MWNAVTPSSCTFGRRVALAPGGTRSRAAWACASREAPWVTSPLSNSWIALGLPGWMAADAKSCAVARGLQPAGTRTVELASVSWIPAAGVIEGTAGLVDPAGLLGLGVEDV